MLLTVALFSKAFLRDFYVVIKQNQWQRNLKTRAGIPENLSWLSQILLKVLHH